MHPGSYLPAGQSSDTGVERDCWIHPALWNRGDGITSRACSEKPRGEEFPQAPWELSSLFSTPDLVGWLG